MGRGKGFRKMLEGEILSGDASHSSAILRRSVALGKIRGANARKKSRFFGCNPARGYLEYLGEIWTVAHVAANVVFYAKTTLQPPFHRTPVKAQQTR
jgi:hypothetical protein